jgi:hypothetical protein
MIIAVYGIFLLGVLLVLYAIIALICWLVAAALKSVPEEYREIRPDQIWLSLIPCFALVWNFFVYHRVARSFQNYCAATGKTQFGDCGETLGLIYSICVVCRIVPCLNYLAWPASLVLVIIVLVKFWGMKAEIERDHADGSMTSSTLDI